MSLKRSERLQEVRMEAEEQALDLAEESLITAVKAGEAWAVLCFLLKTRGKKRGYTERQEASIQVSGADFLAALRDSGRLVEDAKGGKGTVRTA